MPGIAILGCTGSIGDTVFRVLEALGSAYHVTGLAGGRRVDKLIARAREWHPRIVSVDASVRLKEVRAALPGIQVVHGPQGLEEVACGEGVDMVVNGLVGAIGLRPTLAALRSGRTVAMANKEPLVMAGGLILEAAAAGGSELLPLDSEPNALWQCLQGEAPESIQRLILTASGGPFFGQSRADLAAVDADAALRHPTWRMGPKITIDSATLMNKGFEVIEATWLFGVELDQVDVVIHRESVVHSLVEFRDGSLLAHLGKTDMALPIQYALTRPARRTAPVSRLDLVELGTISFAAPDRVSFPCLDLCYDAARKGGAASVALNAADEVAVDAFLHHRLGFLDIERVNAAVTAAAPAGSPGALSEVLELDEWARSAAAEEVAGIG